MTTHDHKENDHKEGAPSCCGNREHNQDIPPSQAQTQTTPLDSLKSEILNSINNQKRAPLSWGSVTVSVVLGILALISIVQVAQSATLYSRLKSGDLKPATTQSSGSAISLPTQVGGC